MTKNPDKFNGLKQRAELLLTDTEPCADADSLYEIRSLLHQLDTYRLELELQHEILQNTHRQLQDIHQDYLNLYNFAPVAFVTLDTSGCIRQANQTLAVLLGISKQQLQSSRFTDYIEAADQDIFYFFRQALLEQHNPPPCEFRLRKQNGQILWVNCEGFLIQLSSGHDINFVITDITLLKVIADDLQLGASIFHDSDEAIMIAAADLNILKVNRAFTLITGFSAEEVIGQKTNLLKSGEQNAFFYQEMWAAINEVGHWQGEILNKRKNGEIYPEWLNISVKKNALNEVSHYIGVFSDITNHKNTESRIHFMAYYDHLTELPNRTLLQDRVNQARLHSRRSGRYSALMLLDLDHFKVINDSLGHDVGDSLLVGVAKRLTGCVRAEDTVARLGGDEFVILLYELNADPQATQLKAATIADKICKLLVKPFQKDQHELHISVSIGITIFQGDAENSAELIKNADNAMYKAKDSGRNKYWFYNTDMKLNADSRLSIENELRNALERAELELYFQAQTHIKKNRICGAEVLLRWNHPLRGVVSPNDFIGIAEQTGLIVPIGTWVLKAACQQIARWNHTGSAKAVEYLAVNVSPHQFKQKDFVEVVINAVAASGIHAHQLELELTEGILIQNIDDTLEKLNALKSQGVRIAIDDFGTGYSSLNYLKRFPLDVLKIDKSFVQDITTDSNDAAIVQTIIALANNLNLRVMAEGVETEEQLAFLRERNCDTFQGFLCSRPLPRIDFIALLALDGE